ncbi:hypothetical protein GIY23_18225 [Allosaccharopolyspora coralli]|uniref:Uncharacterized protein n=1 Tax=Allosaccharopolyspora coralli TaxID=2665642 RepID=A0A5Q3QIB8_9PSEU|nr:hypothetical protein [Allosaccharopolyspora coralli]QGK71199.1 hypothetical protein GIY23_18225 [Allosaccharopolyspora coralli]
MAETLRNIPVELSGHKLLVSEPPVAKTRETESGATEVVTNPADGSTLFVVLLFAKPRPRDGRSGGKGAEIKVTLETDPGDEIDEGTRIELINPRVSHWENELGGRTMSGLSWRATGLKPAA